MLVDDPHIHDQVSGHLNSQEMQLQQSHDPNTSV